MGDAPEMDLEKRLSLMNAKGQREAVMRVAWDALHRDAVYSKLGNLEYHSLNSLIATMGENEAPGLKEEFLKIEGAAWKCHDGDVYRNKQEWIDFGDAAGPARRTLVFALVWNALTRDDVVAELTDDERSALVSLFFSIAHAWRDEPISMPRTLYEALAKRVS